MSALNLLPAPLVERRLRTRRLARWVVVTGVMSVLALTAGLALRISSSSLVLGDGTRLETVMLQAQAQTDEIARLRAETSNLARRADIAAEVKLRPDWSLLLALLAESRDEGVVLRRISLEPVGRTLSPSAFQIDVAGLAQNMQGAQAYVIALEESGIFESVRLNDTSRVTVNNTEAIGFAVTLQLGQEVTR